MSPLRHTIGFLALVWAVRAAEPKPPEVEVNFESAVTGACHLDGAMTGAGGATADFSLQAIQRAPINGRGVYWTLGMQAEHFEFSGGPFRRLQDYGAVVGLEYYRNGEQAAELNLRPGWYFGGRATGKSWDVPIDGVTGVPLGKDCNGVVGFSNARFYHHALPIFGIVWSIARGWRLQLVYPETALEYTLSPATTLRLGGELVGGGFLAEDSARRVTPVEYSSYRVGLGAVCRLAANCKLTVTGGVEAVRSFDAFRAGGRAQGAGAGFVSLNLTVSH